MIEELIRMDRQSATSKGIFHAELKGVYALGTECCRLRNKLQLVRIGANTRGVSAASLIASRIRRIKKRIAGETEAGFPIDNKLTGDTFPVLNNVGRFWISDIDQPRANIADSRPEERRVGKECER